MSIQHGRRAPYAPYCDRPFGRADRGSGGTPGDDELGGKPSGTRGAEMRRSALVLVLCGLVLMACGPSERRTENRVTVISSGSDRTLPDEAR